MSNANRPLLYDLWKMYRFRIDLLAESAGVEEQVILRMFRNESVTRATAEAVLAALSQVIDYECTLETVRVDLDREEIRNARKPIIRKEK